MPVYDGIAPQSTTFGPDNIVCPCNSPNDVYVPCPYHSGQVWTVPSGQWVPQVPATTTTTTVDFVKLLGQAQPLSDADVDRIAARVLEMAQERIRALARRLLPRWMR